MGVPDAVRFEGGVAVATGFRAGVAAALGSEVGVAEAEGFEAGVAEALACGPAREGVRGVVRVEFEFELPVHVVSVELA